ncbi:hypothetical protein DUI87_06424 [Hirundo rustica rustica]|uniref:Uncharacterized protein n=1 Tax=Hirundo rustica rustica TaxID=333673 RepID=A0A3M0KT67_HIRRU|nr:hypothetical protein DUI87_06424 [Hirundo rustica rustica]
MVLSRWLGLNHDMVEDGGKTSIKAGAWRSLDSDSRTSESCRGSPDLNMLLLCTTAGEFKDHKGRRHRNGMKLHQPEVKTKAVVPDEDSYTQLVYPTPVSKGVQTSKMFFKDVSTTAPEWEYRTLQPVMGSAEISSPLFSSLLFSLLFSSLLFSFSSLLFSSLLSLLSLRGRGGEERRRGEERRGEEEERRGEERRGEERRGEEREERRGEESLTWQQIKTGISTLSPD